MTFTEFSSSIKSIWFITSRDGHRKEKDGFKLSDADISQLYDKFSKNRMDGGHLAVVNDYAVAQNNYSYTTYDFISEQIKMILPANISRYTVVICKCGKSLSLKTADLFTNSGALECSGKFYDTCNVSFEHGYIKTQLVTNKGQTIYI
jgi:hypothetical protein